MDKAVPILQVSPLLKRLLAQDMNITIHNIETHRENEQEDEVKDLVIICVGIAVIILMLVLQKYSGTDRTKR